MNQSFVANVASAHSMQTLFFGLAMLQRLLLWLRFTIQAILPVSMHACVPVMKRPFHSIYYTDLLSSTFIVAFFIFASPQFRNLPTYENTGVRTWKQEKKGCMHVSVGKGSARTQHTRTIYAHSICDQGPFPAIIECP